MCLGINSHRRYNNRRSYVLQRALSSKSYPLLDNLQVNLVSSEVIPDVCRKMASS